MKRWAQQVTALLVGTAVLSLTLVVVCIVWAYGVVRERLR